VGKLLVSWIYVIWIKYWLFMMGEP
jgi:hypothetical protein